MDVPAELARAAEAAVASRLEWVQEFKVGEGRRVFRCETEFGAVIVKVDRPESLRRLEFARETLTRVGVPVPDTIASEPDAQIPFTITALARGVSLDQVPHLIDDALRNVGEVVARMHSIVFDEPGWFDPARLPQPVLIRRDLLDQHRRAPWGLGHILEQRIINEEQAEAIRRISAESLDLYEAVPDVFVHGDFREEHIFVDPETLRVTDVIDFGDIRSDHPAWDFVPLHLSHPDLLPRLLDGYGDVSYDVDRTLAVFAMQRLVGEIGWLHENDFDLGDRVERLGHMLDEVKALHREVVWKREQQARWTTPVGVLDAAVVRATGAEVVSRGRWIGGESNEVWRFGTARGDDLVVRISRWGSYAGERWAAERSREAGAPVPRVLLAEDDVTAGDEIVSIWIHELARGDALRDIDPAASVVEQAGEHLARIHSVATTGFGPIDENGIGRLRSFPDFLTWSEGAARHASAVGVTQEEIDRSAELIDGSEGLWLSPRLAHGDWIPEHVLVHGDAVSAIIDFGGTISGDPSWDLSYWVFWDRGEQDYPSLSAIIRGYERIADPGPKLEERMALCNVARSIGVLSYFAGQGREELARFCAANLRRALAALS